MNKDTIFTVKEILEATAICNRRGCTIEKALESIITAEQNRAIELQSILDLDPRKMTKTEITTATFKLPNMPSNLYEDLTFFGFKTGSSVYGAVGAPVNDEDWCVLMPPTAFIGYTLGQDDQGYWEADGFSSVYCHIDDKLINILCFSDNRLFTAWSCATDAMTKLQVDLSTAFILGTKWKRVRIFRALKDALYDPINKKSMPKDDAWKYEKCTCCSQEAINFTCRDAKNHYQLTAICERCSGITY